MVGYDFNIPVKINKRLTTTLGRVKWVGNTETITPISMEFSYQFLKTSTPECIDEVIKHECAHYLVTIETRQNHGHDKVFKEMCKRIGCTNDTTNYNNLKRIVPKETIYK